MASSQFEHAPMVSIVMPAYNSARTLKEAIDSVLSQSFKDFELIICNDASTDETENILNDITDDRVKVINNSLNTGEGLSRDGALDVARGAWVAFIDADDVWKKDRLEILFNEVNRTQDVMIFDDIIQCHDTQHGLVPWRALWGKYAFGGNGISTIFVPTEDYVSSKRLLIKPLFRLNVIRLNRIRHTNKKFAADTEFFLKVLSCGLNLHYVPKAMYYYRITPGSATSLATRCALLREVLEETIEKFTHSPSVQAAFKKKICMVAREEKYLPFVLELKKKNFYKAFLKASHSSWIIFELFSRIGISLNYQIHRIWRGGRTRGI